MFELRPSGHQVCGLRLYLVIFSAIITSSSTIAAIRVLGLWCVGILAVEFTGSGYKKRALAELELRLYSSESSNSTRKV